MSEVALYRKYRPESFKDVVGQEHIIQVLEAQIKSETPAHAYLFAGSRGTGKTTLARIVAKELGSDWKDIQEIDAASNTGVDDIKAILENVFVLPFESKYRVYIIDEVHMLSKHAFNALLKTLEEPPKHVIFILATTEEHKLPETVISRCQSFKFKRPTESELRDRLSYIAKKEGYAVDQASLSLIALLGEGSFRDAIGILEQVISVSKDKKVTIDEVEKITGAPSITLVHDLIKEVLDQSTDKALEILYKVQSKNLEVKIFAKLLLQTIRYTMLVAYAPELKKEISGRVTDPDMKFFEEISKHPNAKILPAFLKEIIATYGDIDNAYIKSLPLELAITKVSKLD